MVWIYHWAYILRGYLCRFAAEPLELLVTPPPETPRGVAGAERPPSFFPPEEFVKQPRLVLLVVSLLPVRFGGESATLEGKTNGFERMTREGGMDRSLGVACTPSNAELS